MEFSMKKDSLEKLEFKYARVSLLIVDSTKDDC